MTSDRTRLYRDKLNGKWKGVAAGIADYTGVEALWVRVAIVALALTPGMFPFVFFSYLIAAWSLPVKPPSLYEQSAEQAKFWQGVRQSPKRTGREVRARLRDLDRRLIEAELHFTGGNRALADEIERLR